MLISAIAIIVMAICAMVLFYDILKKQIFDDLKANAHVISMMNPEDLPDEINYNLNEDGLRITLINEDGTVIYDSMEDEIKDGKSQGTSGDRFCTGSRRGACDAEINYVRKTYFLLCNENRGRKSSAYWKRQ